MLLKDIARKRSVGFTLAEFLLAVVILFILAAVAIPPGGDFRDRAKVSRAKSDMRSLATAVEAYFADHKEYPAMMVGPLCASNIAGGNLTRVTFRLCDANDPNDFLATLTSPIGYITTYPTDPFSKGTVFGYRQWPHTWIMMSFGPDRDEGERLPGDHYNILPQVEGRVVLLDDGVTTGLIDVNFEPSFNLMVLQPTPEYLSAVGVRSGNSLVYDPTNGTISEGDVPRFKQ
ncbi:hypothetical protein ACFL34_04320 [Candidatus Sumerlaeota bacterium]